MLLIKTTLAEVQKGLRGLELESGRQVVSCCCPLSRKLLVAQTGVLVAGECSRPQVICPNSGTLGDPGRGPLGDQKAAKSVG